MITFLPMNRRTLLKNLMTTSGLMALGFAIGRYFPASRQNQDPDRIARENTKGLWFVGSHGGAYGPGKDISEAFNLTASAKGNQPGMIIFPPADSPLLVKKATLNIPDNTLVDLNGNTLRLANKASRYLFTNQPTATGSIHIINGHIDGNKQGKQQRRYDHSIDDADYGKIYPCRDNYAGFTLLFTGLASLVIQNVSIANQEGWAIAHFLCDEATFENITFTGTPGTGRNGDGITGVATRITRIRNINGYTNDDMCAISTSRATVDGVSVFNPREGRDITLFDVDGLTTRRCQQYRTYIGAGIYASDNHTIETVSLKNIQGDFAWNAVRIGNFWSEGPYPAPNGVITQLALSYSTIGSNASNVDIFAQSILSVAITNSTFIKQDVGDISDASPDFIASKDDNAPAITLRRHARVNHFAASAVHFRYDLPWKSGERHFITLTEGATAAQIQTQDIVVSPQHIDKRHFALVRPETSQENRPPTGTQS